MKKKVTTIAREVKPRVVYSEKIFETILDRVAGGESLLKVCSTPDMPTRKSFFKWVEADSSLLLQYEAAVRLRADALFEEIDDVSDQAVQAENAVQVAGLRLKADNIKWKLARMNAKKYGDRVQNEHSGPDGGNIPVSLAVSFVPADR